MVAKAVIFSRYVTEREMLTKHFIIVQKSYLAYCYIRNHNEYIKGGGLFMCDIKETNK